MDSMVRFFRVPLYGPPGISNVKKPTGKSTCVQQAGTNKSGGGLILRNNEKGIYGVPWRAEQTRNRRYGKERIGGRPFHSRQIGREDKDFSSEWTRQKDRPVQQDAKETGFAWTASQGVAPGIQANPRFLE